MTKIGETERFQIYEAALDKWGLDLQINMVSEECAELIIALNKWRRGKPGTVDLRTIAEEIADVRIMLEQMELAFKCAKLVEVLTNDKIRRLKHRVSD